MLAKLYAIEIAEGRIEFSRVPKFLKTRVKKELKNMGLEHLIKEKVHENDKTK